MKINSSINDLITSMINAMKEKSVCTARRECNGGPELIYGILQEVSLSEVMKDQQKLTTKGKGTV